MLPIQAPSMRTWETRLPPSSTTAIFMGCLISTAFCSAAAMTLRASSSVSITILYHGQICKRRSKIDLPVSRLPKNNIESWLQHANGFISTTFHRHQVFDNPPNPFFPTACRRLAVGHPSAFPINVNGGSDTTAALSNERKEYENEHQIQRILVERFVCAHEFDDRASVRR